MVFSLGLPKPWPGRVAPVERYALMPYTPIDRGGPARQIGKFSGRWAERFDGREASIMHTPHAQQRR
jgi:hypothetical protein